MQKLDWSLRHSTNKEIEFLEGIVNGRWISGRSEPMKKHALTSYVKASRGRVWDAGVDEAAVMCHAGMLLESFA